MMRRGKLRGDSPAYAAAGSGDNRHGPLVLTWFTHKLHANTQAGDASLSSTTIPD